MKKNILQKIVLMLLLSVTVSTFSQNKQEKEKIKKQYDLIKLNNLKESFLQKQTLEKNKALQLAQIKGWRVRYEENGTLFELMRVTKEGTPIYYKTDNVDAAISTRTNFLHNGGGLGLNLEGQGMTAYVWDGGLARETHQEYDGDGGEDRFSAGDGTTSLSFHGAHVMGTIISSGFDPNAKGMAPKAKGIGNDWTNDLAEATDAAANGMLLSNHSYGNQAVNIPDWWFGAYIDEAQAWDNLMYNAPYYLQVNSAGNDGGNNTANGAPLEGNSAFDKINGRKASKNAMVIANGQDATINGDGTLSTVFRNSSSSEGPMDDLRIKPDLMGNGTGLYSTYEDSDDDYNTISGTSMASPNVTGSLLLLQQHHNDSYGSFMRAATLKGLALHTADDADIEGPDPHAGWGLLNTKVAVETITKNGFESWISEEVLSNGGTYSINVKSDGFSPLLASISWTDKPGEINEGITNDSKAALVNDLDIRVSKDGVEYLPWRLTGIYSNEKGDNLVDPFERVDIDGASGEYTITVTHKGTLDEAQRFSLIVTGISGEFTFLADESDKSSCSDADAVFNFEYREAIAGTTNFTAEGVPTGVTTTFSSTSLSGDGSFDITFSNLDNVPAGVYPIEIVGDNGNEILKRQVRLTVFQSDFIDNPSILEFPANGQRGIPVTQITLGWAKNINAESYLVEVSDSPSFSNVLFTTETTGLEFAINDLASESIYYWRIQPKNFCGIGSFSEMYSFQTGFNDCSYVYNATDFSNASGMPFVNNETMFVPIEVTEDLLINTIKVTTDISHTDIRDLTLTIIEPDVNGGTTATLLSGACDDTDDISNVTFDDSADELSCSTTTPAISGMVKPEDNLSTFGGTNAKGTWNLSVNDFDLFDGGQINSASITVCASIENTSTPSFTSSSIELAANSTYIITTSNIEASSTSETSEQQVYTVIEAPANGSLLKESTMLNAGDTFTQLDVDTNKISYSNTQTTYFTDQFKVDIKNAVNGWLPNQIISIAENTLLSVDSFELNQVSIWPNPASSELNIKLSNLENKEVLLSLFDLQGRTVLYLKDNPIGSSLEKKIDTENISSGIYLLKINQGNKSITKKVIVTE